jgi:hypothetical protein
VSIKFKFQPRVSQLVYRSPKKPSVLQSSGHSWILSLKGYHERFFSVFLHKKNLMFFQVFWKIWKNLSSSNKFGCPNQKQINMTSKIDKILNMQKGSKTNSTRFVFFPFISNALQLETTRVQWKSIYITIVCRFFMSHRYTLFLSGAAEMFSI